MRTAASLRQELARGAAKAIEKSRAELARTGRPAASPTKRKPKGPAKPTRVRWWRVEQVLHVEGLRLISELNRREHPMATHKRKKAQQQIVHAAFVAERMRAILKPLGLRLSIQITRIGPGNLDSDNRTSSAKWVRDQVARELGVDDGDERLRWTVFQSRRGPGVYGCEIAFSTWLQISDVRAAFRSPGISCEITFDQNPIGSTNR